MLRMVMAALSFLMISNVPYPVMPPVGVGSPRKLIGLGVLVTGTAMLIFGRLEYFFPLAVVYVAFGLLRAVILGLLDRRNVAIAGGWFPGGRTARSATGFEHVGEDVPDGDTGDAPYFRRRRRRGVGGGDAASSNPGRPT
jgi:hypothetical protein